MFYTPVLSLILWLPSLVSASRHCSLTRPKSWQPAPPTTQQPLTPPGGNASSCSGNNFRANSWYAGWHSADFPLANVSWTKYTSLTYAFATTTSDPSSVSLAASDEELLPEFVKMAHENNVSAFLSVGGWTGSQFFSTNVGSAANRTIFVKTISDLVSTYNLDGVEFDWEYPGRQGIGCNMISPQDSNNLLAFLQELRGDPIGKNLTISMAVSLTPFAGSDGTPMLDVSNFSEVLDYVSIMAYDVWGSWTPSGVGPNAPLNDSCASSEQQEGSVVSAISAWTVAGFPAHQLVVGIASYGHSFYVVPSAALTASGMLAAYPPFDASLQPHGDTWDSGAGIDQCGNPTPVGGIFDFWGLVDGGFLDTNGMPEENIDYRFDNCSQTPYVYNPASNVMVSYDDAHVGILQSVPYRLGSA